MVAADANEPEDALVSFEGIRKVFPNGTIALDRIDFRISRAEVRGLVGANGAGKSTLIKILAGASSPTDGRIWKGGHVDFTSPADARRAGISTIHQHVPLADDLTVIENVFLGERGWRRRSESLEQRFWALTEQVGYEIAPRVSVRDLALGDRQMVAILQALAHGADLVVMDEPTASLSRTERQLVADTVRRLSAEGTAFLYVSHFLEEVLDLCDAVTVLRDGRVALDVPAAGLSEDELVRAMVGRDVLAAEREAATEHREPGPVVLEVRGLDSPRGVHDVSFDVRAGEIVALAGLLGSGRSEILHAVFGSDALATGTVRIDGSVVAHSTAARVNAGVALVPEERNAQGLIPNFELWRNVSLPDLDTMSAASFVPRRSLERARAEKAVQALGIRTPGIDANVGDLSGGNAQKVVFAKWIFGDFKVLLLDEPTAGVDVGAKADILRLIREQAREGRAVVLVSSEFEEVASVADRVLIVRDGQIVAERDAAETSEHELVLLASGLQSRNGNGARVAG